MTTPRFTVIQEPSPGREAFVFDDVAYPACSPASLLKDCPWQKGQNPANNASMRKANEANPASFIFSLNTCYGWRWVPATTVVGVPRIGPEIAFEIHYQRSAYVKPPKPTVTPETFLDKSKQLLGDRGKEYDKPDGEKSMATTVAAFNLITRHCLTEAEGWLLMQLLKDVRQWSKADYHQDSAEDGVTYSALKAEALATGKKSNLPHLQAKPEGEK